MAAEKIGDARCPLCHGTARVSLSKSGYVVMTMNCCNAQLFTRSPRSDELVRDLIKPAAPDAREPAPVLAVPPIETEKKEPPAAQKKGFGLLGSWT